MAGSRKRKLNQLNSETSAHNRQNSRNEANGRQHAGDNRPPSRPWPVTREFKSEPQLYFRCDSGSRDNSHRGDSHQLSTPSSNPTPTNVPTSSSSNMAAQESLQRVTELFLRLFSDRISDLDETYDPELDNPLSEAEVGELRDNLANYLSFEQNDATTVLNHLLSEATEYVENTIFPYINENISYAHFRRTFVRIIRVITKIRGDLDSILSYFPSMASCGVTISENCTSTIYTTYAPQLVNAVLSRLHQKRLVQDIDAHPAPYYVFEIAKYFTDFDDDLWKNRYITNIYYDTVLFLQSFDLQSHNIEFFVDLASSRKEKELVFANSLGFDSTTSEEAAKRVYTAFSMKFDEFVEDNPQLSLENQLRLCTEPTWFNQVGANPNQAGAERFLKVLFIYGRGDLWDVKREELKDEIMKQGNGLIHTFQVPSNNWDMQSLAIAIRTLAMYEKAVRDAFHMPTINLPRLRNMLREVFKGIFRKMFPRNIGRKLPEQFLAEFVEHVAMNTGAGTDWQETYAGYIQRITRYIHRKSYFISCIQRRIRAHEPRNIESRNRAFLDILLRVNRVTPVPQELIDSTRRACRPRLRAEQVARRRAQVVFTQYKGVIPLTEDGHPDPDGVLTNIEIDNLLLYVVAVRRFCGQRESVYIRMTRMQLEMFNFLLQFRKCSMSTVRQLIYRTEPIFTVALTELTLTKVLDSLSQAGLLVVEENEENVFVALANPTLTEPYMEVGPLDSLTDPLDTDIRFVMDHMISEYVAQVNNCETPALIAHVYNNLPDVRFDMVFDRMYNLETRNFITFTETGVSFVPFTQ